MSELELKLCPFCGGTAEIVIWDKLNLFVRCKECKVRTDFVEVSAEYTAKEKAIELWNRRFY